MAPIATELLKSIDRHEQFHAGIELLALVRDDHRHWPLQLAKRGKGLSHIRPKDLSYLKYYQEIYKPNWPEVSCLEESLATASQFASDFEYPGLREALAETVKKTPPAYSAWRTYETDFDFDKAHHKLAAVVLGDSEQWIQARAVPTLTGTAEERLWLPPANPDLLNSFGEIPRYLWRSDQHTPEFFSQGVFGNFRTRTLLGCLEKKFDAVIHHGGRHPAVVFPGGAKVLYSSSWATVPPFFLRQITSALGVRRHELLSQCA